MHVPGQHCQGSLETSGEAGGPREGPPGEPGSKGISGDSGGSECLRRVEPRGG